MSSKIIIFAVQSSLGLVPHLTEEIVYTNLKNYVINDDCVACGTCIDECPVGAISEGEKYSINPDECTECGTCADACPSGAITL